MPRLFRFLLLSSDPAAGATQDLAEQSENKTQGKKGAI